MESIGPYRLDSELGHGAMGVVYRGFDPAIGRAVAIKIIRTDQFTTANEKAELRLRFAREATAAGKLSHPNIVTVYHLGEQGDLQYLVLELVDGWSLEKALSNGIPQDRGATISILSQVADALDYAHGEGIVHRDVKPANILVRRDGTVKITDFGIARISSQTITGTGSTMGTPAYMAPEQIMSARVSGQADQFSLAVIAYQMLSGRRPFVADTDPALIFKIVSEEAQALHELDPSFPPRASEVLRKGMAKDPSQRFATCAEFIRGLSDTLSEQMAAAPVAASPPLPAAVSAAAAGVVRARKRAPVWAITLGAGTLVIVILLVVLGVLKHRAQRPVAVTEPKAAAPVDHAADRRADAIAATPPTRPVEVAPPAAAAPPSVGRTAGKSPDAPAAAPPPAVNRGPHVGDSKVNPRDGLKYMWIPPGTFVMGCSPGDGECTDNEKPAHEVTISKGIWLGQTDVTQAAYQRVVGRNPSYFKGDNLPVETVNWDEARSYCQAIGGRLPTEAEWEYAARAGSSAARYGNLNDIAWYSNNSGGKTHDVGRKQANAFGLYDMLGNVFQWTADWFGGYQAGEQRDPTGPPGGTPRTLRGGSWHSDPRSARASSRGRVAPADRGYLIGLRCVSDASAPPHLGEAASATATPPPVSRTAAGRADLPAEAPPVANRGPRAGDSAVNPRDGLKYMWIPPGTFMMGCSPGDDECFDQERPAHKVTISRGFWIGQTEVPQEAYERVMGTNPSQFKGAKLPVENTNWEDARKYCASSGMRLPTEAEWEYAARGGTGGSRYGDIDRIAWYSVILNGPGRMTHEEEVGRKQANPWGVFDMLGNVWEWVEDWYAKYPLADASDPTGPTGGTLRAIRGGGYGYSSGYIRASFRTGLPSRNPNLVGVRCAGTSVE